MPEKQIILIIDDSPSNIKIMNEILKEDYIITVATNGERAMSSLEINNFSQTDPFDEKRPLPDIILLDIVMPGMDGYEVCRQIKKNKSTSDIPIIFITSKDDIEDEEKGFQMGAVDYITKPVSPSIVKARIKTHLLLKKQRDLLQNSISVLQHRTELLLHKAELGMLAAGLAHDINNILFVAM
ncbi:MAG: response regulator, partial [Desulfamplus sp.]|nr:response regulator [Desulfamplus sp.]